MNTLEIKSEITICQLNELSPQEQSLIQSSREALDISHSPYSKFKVGCAMRLENGTVVKGANQENAAYPICLCAEGVTLASVASQHPHVKIVDVAIHVPIDTPASPCGYCRQSFKEYEVRMNTKFNFYLAGNQDVYMFKGIDTILPLAFSSIDLE